MIHLILFTMFVLLQVADAYTTWAVLDMGGSERNKLLARLFLRFGVVRTLITIKVAILVAMVLVYVPSVFLFALVVFYLAVVLNNVRALRQTVVL